jgi:hypothetical protein
MAGRKNQASNDESAGTGGDFGESGFDLATRAIGWVQSRKFDTNERFTGESAHSSSDRLPSADYADFRNVRIFRRFAMDEDG